MVTRMLRVFHREHAGRPLRVVWTLEEIGVPYELTVMNWDEGQSEEHRARHPIRRVPVLAEDDGYVFESAAICLHLADQHLDAGLVPPLATHERALVYQWTTFAPAELEPWLIEAATWADRDPERSAAARERFWKAAAAVGEALGRDDFLVGNRFTVADVLVGTVLGFTSRAGFADELPQNLRDYVTRLTERPAYQRAAARTSG
jgi:glutathione S-transferase